MQEFSRRTLLQSSAALAVGGLSWRTIAAYTASSSASSITGDTIEHRIFGKTGLSIAVLGFGGAEIGYENTDQKTVDELLNAALDAGLDVVDTAECYINSEEQIARAIGHRRKDYHLFTKVGHWVPDGQPKDFAWTKDGVLASIERSLKRLNTDVLELVQLHSCNVDILKRGECIEGLEAAKKAGKTRFIGYSGDAAAARFAVESGRFDTLQTSVNICDQQSIELTLPLAKQKNMGVIAKRPIANAVWRYDAPPKNDYHTEYYSRLQKLDYDFAKGDRAKDAGPEGAAGIALRFTLMQHVHTAIVGTSNPKRWAQNAGLTKAGPLTDAQHKSIRETWKKTAPENWVGQV